MSNVVTFFKPEKPEMVYECVECESQMFKICMDGRIKCDSCGNKWLLPDEFITNAGKWHPLEVEVDDE